MTGRALSLKALEETLNCADPETRHETLRAVTSLFLDRASNYDEAKIDAFDDVFAALIDGSSHSDLLDISCRMAPVENAPRRLVRKLAENPEISIAGPVLSQSPRLSTGDLCDIAREKGNLHMLAISRRIDVPEPVTDILLERGDGVVANSVVGNTGAKLSQRGIERVLDRGQTDQALVDRLERRPDISENAIEQAKQGLALTAARQHQIKMRASGRAKLVLSSHFGETEVKSFAAIGDYEGVVAAISVLANLDYDILDNMMKPNRVSGIALVCKALGFSWTTVDMILSLARSQNEVSAIEIGHAHRDYVSMRKTTADRIIRFWQARQSIRA